MRAILPFVLLAAAATLPACTCASSEPGAPASTGASAGAAGAGAAGAENAAGASARLVRTRPPALRLNPNVSLRNARPSPNTVTPVGSAP